MLRRIAIFARPDLRESIMLARTVYRRLRDLGAEPYYDISIAGLTGGPAIDLRFEHVDGVVVIGGDGTLLRLLQILGEKSPVLHLVKLGHRAVLFPDDASVSIERLRDFVAGNFWIEEHTRLLVDNNGAISYALNEALVTALGSKVVYLDVLTENEEIYSDMGGDGVIVATPLGSTAYNYSAGGPVVHPMLDVMVITPLNPMNREFASVIVPGHVYVFIRVKYTLRPVKLIVDGAKEYLLTRGSEVKITLRGPPARFARYGEKRVLRLPWARKCSS
ncbi:NAD(+) kinase [Pyrofollis japonicus]|uniref:NAD(+)/NADH kinase n=1 Tax=Pyrofollis japonicus TaxID=3060460 RepID=UPI00295BE8A7|nr:NAD(+)/NADH kinase [Pyrofollis japonicus]BEP17981.1 NAD(+) kinase [Pyrofollis japonicus]